MSNQTQEKCPWPAAPIHVEQLSAASEGCDRNVESNDFNCIQKRAYFLWEQAGCPTSDGQDFWLAAEKELTCPANENNDNSN